MKLGAVAENTNAVRMPENKKERAAGTEFKEGQIIEGTVTNVGDKVSMDFSGRTLNFAKESVPGAAKGQVRRFQVMSSGEKGVTLREISVQASGRRGSGVAAMQVDNSRVLTAQAEQEEADAQEEESDAAGRLTGEDYEALIKEKYTLEGFNLTRLARAIERVKAGRQEREEATISQHEKKKQFKEEIRSMAEHSLKNGPMAEYLTNLLARANIPVTQEKIDEIAEAVTYGVEAVAGLSDGAKAYLIGNGRTPDITNLYKAAHSGAAKQQKLTEEVWEELRPAAEGVLAEAGIAADDGGLFDARWLMEHDLALTPENLVYKRELDMLAEECTPQQMLEQAVDAVAKGNAAVQAELAKEPQQLWDETRAERYVQEFAQILPETVDAAAKRLGTEGKDAGQELSLDFLKQVQQMLRAGGRDGISIEDVTARRQLEEIRLKLTAEAGARLLHQGIHLDTDGLGKIVEGLRAIENEYYQNLYREVGGDGEDAGSIALLRATDEAVTQLKDAPAYVLGVTFHERAIQTVASLKEAGGELAAQFDRAMEHYEALMTKPRADMGDSIKTAFRNVGEVLSGMGLAATPENERAVRIMAYNHIELTKENLDGMKLYDAKVQELLENMNPAACASLIKKGINPIDMPIDDLNASLAALAGEEGATTEEKYSNYLVMLDQKKGLTAEERESYIGIYRLLNQVTKSDGAAIGVLAASGRELTLGNLLSAVRTRKKGGVDTVVDDTLGGVSAADTGNKSISDQIGAAFGYQQLMAGRVAEDLTPDKLAAIGGSEAALAMTPEELSRALKEADNTAEAGQFSQERAQELADTVANSGAEQTFLSHFHEEKTVRALRAARHLLGGTSVKERIREIAGKYGVDGEMSEIDMEKAGNAQNLQDMVEEWADSADKVIDGVFGNAALGGEDSMLLLSLQGAVRLSRSLAKQEFYEIPLQSGGGFVKMNLTVVHTGSEKGSVSIRLKGEETVDISLKVEGNRISGYVVAASRGELDRMRQGEDTLRQSLKEQGFEVARWDYGLQGGSVDPSLVQNMPAAGQGAPKEDAGTGKTRTDNLYLAARTVIKMAVPTERKDRYGL